MAPSHFPRKKLLKMQKEIQGNVEIFVDGKISQILILSTERLRDPEREKVQFSAFKTSE